MSVGYSPAEQSVLDLLKNSGQPLDINQLVDLHYQDRERPYNSKVVMAATLRSLADKIRINQENFEITRIRRPNNPSIFRVEAAKLRKERRLTSKRKVNV